MEKLTIDILAERLCENIETAAGVAPTDEGREAVRAWCGGTGRDGISREELLADRAGQAAGRLLLHKVARRADHIRELLAGVWDADAVGRLEASLWGTTFLCGPPLLPDPDDQDPDPPDPPSALASPPGA